MKTLNCSVSAACWFCPSPWGATGHMQGPYAIAGTGDTGDIKYQVPNNTLEQTQNLHQQNRNQTIPRRGGGF